MSSASDRDRPATFARPWPCCRKTVAPACKPPSSIWTPRPWSSASGSVAPLLRPGALRCLRENLFRLPQNPHAADLLGTPDFLICSGLFDYLPDEAATAMLRLFWGRLAEGGVLLVGNFAPHNPTRAYMEWIGNWYLTYRTGSDLERLATRAGISQGRFSLGSEALGVDLILTARK